jgi:hypothetical protein
MPRVIEDVNNQNSHTQLAEGSIPTAIFEHCVAIYTQ